MSDDTQQSVRAKVKAIFSELAGDRAQKLDGSIFPASITSTVTEGLAGPGACEKQLLHADQISFHLTDWNSDAAFMVALHLFPERFTPAEINIGINLFLCHLPGHVIAAAKLAGHPA